MIRPAHTFCGVPFADLPTLIEADVAIFASAYGTLYKPGVASHAAYATESIRQALSSRRANPETFDFDTVIPVYGGNRLVDCENTNDSLKDGTSDRFLIADATRHIINSGVHPVLLGSDDSNSIPFVEGLAENMPVTILQHDAHVDMCVAISCIKVNRQFAQ